MKILENWQHNLLTAHSEYYRLFKELFGADIPFTNSKYIYSYGITIKAGFDFNEIEWNEKGNTIEVKLPEVKILSSEIDQDSSKYIMKMRAYLIRLL